MLADADWLLFQVTDWNDDELKDEIEKVLLSAMKA
jgi:hypothetical protein